MPKVKPKETVEEISDTLKKQVDDNAYNIRRNLRAFYEFADMTSESVNKLIDRVDELESKVNIIEGKLKDTEMTIKVIFSILGIAFCSLITYVLLN